MNYGYAGNGAFDAIELSEDDAAERYCAQLYHTVAAQIDLSGMRVLDVGSGRGGGAAHVHRYLGPRQTVGLDLAAQAVRFCSKVYGDLAGLSFQRGDAMDMPFAPSEFDAVLNIESSHCYPDRRAFLSEVYRVLHPGGRFLFADFTRSNAPPEREAEALVRDIRAAGFEDLRVTDITPNIVEGLERDDDRRSREIRRGFPVGLRRAARLWAGTTDSWIYHDFAAGRRRYLMIHAAKRSESLAPLQDVPASPDLAEDITALAG